MSTVGLIMAGGRGSRLGPLAAQISKALVPIGQRPHLVHQIELMRKNDVGTIVVVASPDTERQIGDMIDRAGLLNVVVYVQPLANGPVGAIDVGLRKALTRKIFSWDDRLYVLMSDTYLPEDYRFPVLHESWAGVAFAPSERSFCWRGGEDGAYIDGVVKEGTPVTIGLYGFPTVQRAANETYGVMRDNLHEDEVGMAPFLTGVNAEPIPVGGWMDIGDLQALAAARRTKFVARAHHTLELNAAGVITKKGSGEAFERQATYLDYTGYDQTLFPRIIDTTATSISMEYVDLPTLSELWLYWPGRPDTWATIIADLLDQLEARLWDGVQGNGDRPTERAMFIDKTLARLEPRWQEVFGDRVEMLSPLFEEAPCLSSMVFPHGDLNFNNILFSLNAGTFKLLDPRGDYSLPLLYEIAKLRYSYNGGFAAITHNLFDCVEYAYPSLWPKRKAEADAIDEVLSETFSLEKLTAAEACLLLAGSVMHDDKQARVMRWRADELLKEVGA